MYVLLLHCYIGSQYVAFPHHVLPQMLSSRRGMSRQGYCEPSLTQERMRPHGQCIQVEISDIVTHTHMLLPPLVVLKAISIHSNSLWVNLLTSCCTAVTDACSVNAAFSAYNVPIETAPRPLFSSILIQNNVADTHKLEKTVVNCSSAIV